MKLWCMLYDHTRVNNRLNGAPGRRNIECETLQDRGSTATTVTASMKLEWVSCQVFVIRC